jgi:predicted MFS family arabinose efflux permease
VITSLSISAVAGRINRKTLLLSLTALMCLSGSSLRSHPTMWRTWQAGR